MPESRTASLLRELVAAPGREERLVHLRVRPARAAVHSEWPDWVHTDVRAAVQRRGVDRLWSHQRTAAEAAHAGEHVVLASGTGSGKSLAYLLPGLDAILRARRERDQRGAAVLYLSPTKALAQDQLAGLRDLGLGVRAATHDGDSSPEEREWNRTHAEYLLTNPDMLHRSLLPRHRQWAKLLGCVRYVVVDECHHYRGVFGAHVAQILRRLRRVCAQYGADPVFVLSSATVAEPEVSAARLTGLSVRPVTEDGAPRGELTLGLWEPPFVSRTGEGGAPVRRPAGSEVADLLTDLVSSGVRTLAFVRSRRGAESVALTARRLLEEVDPSLSARVASYRGGYLPEERRALEEALRSGRLLGLAATNALELGIDISGLDAVLVAGFPGTRAALWQQIGRAGRGGQEAAAVFVAREDPLDTYLVHHPEALLDAPVEATVFDPENPYVLGPHLCAAAEEIPLTEEDFPLFGETTAQAVAALTEAGMLRRRPRGWFWTDRRRASELADIRSTGGAAVRLVEESTGRVLGTVDASSAHATAHPGAVYLHQGEPWLVRDLDTEHHVATVVREDPGYTTHARDITDIRVLREHQHTAWGSCRLSLGSVEVSQRVVSFLKRSVPSGEVVAEEPLDLPVRQLQTTAVWWTVPERDLEGALDRADLPGAAHAAEHAAIGLLPLFATCDRWDIGGVSTAVHPDTGQLTVFVYDGHPGGAGFAERGYRLAHRWLGATRDGILGCGCLDGCPSCVQSPKCGNQNNPLDKRGAVRLLEVLLRHSPAADAREEAAG